MTLSITIPDELAEELSRTAQAVGKTPQEVAVSAFAETSWPPRS